MNFKEFENKVEEYMFFDKKSLAEILAMRDLKEKENENESLKKASSIFYCKAINSPCLDMNCSQCLFGHTEEKFVSTYTTTDKIKFTQSM